MYHLKLIKGLSYFGVVKATSKSPDVFVKEKADADKAVATGYFRLVVGTEQNPEPQADSKKYEKAELEAMTMEQLKAPAATSGVKNTRGMKKDDIINDILWAQGNYSTGSPTMIDLQEEK